MTLGTSTASQALVIGIVASQVQGRQFLAESLWPGCRAFICLAESAVLEQYVRRLKRAKGFFGLHCERVNNNGFLFGAVHYSFPRIRLGMSSSAWNLIVLCSG
jgi:hypothetical protein